MRVGLARGVSLALLILALALKVVVPPGFMVASDAGAFPLVICTGHGPLVIDNHGDQKAPSHKSSDAPCAFAGSATPPSLVATIAAPLAMAAAQVGGVQDADQAPGRGLAAPPPPSQAPPGSLDLT